MGDTEAALERELADLLRKAEATDHDEDQRYGVDRLGDELPARHSLTSLCEQGPNSPNFLQVAQSRKSHFPWISLADFGAREGLTSPHNPKVAGSNPAPATNQISRKPRG